MILELIENKINKRHKLFALLIDPDHHTEKSLISLTQKANEALVDLIFIGGSLLTRSIDDSIQTLKKHTSIPVLLFPGSLLQLSTKADGVLLLSLISGRNPDLLIGNHVVAASYLKQSKLEILPTGYMLVEGGKTTSVEYMSNTKPIPSDKPDIAVATAMAGEMLGLKLIYLEAGSGAKAPLTTQTISQVKNNIHIPLIVGGGITTPEDIQRMVAAGADIIVSGTALEQDPQLLKALVQAAHQ
ncbi:MAG: geranylgeranylglyceryl/heptaprenylglyceryl phosphate synthase [Bacteroidales bacterium]|jgi:putative glycerol-1-phosphate prenyltransferase|nr:geranylgeranylglyceryl/heptaprenylglyceryl phosphate synthase [Bacteroidales bacterium]